MNVEAVTANPTDLLFHPLGDRCVTEPFVQKSPEVVTFELIDSVEPREPF
jgi:hypothetical protein